MRVLLFRLSKNPLASLTFEVPSTNDRNDQDVSCQGAFIGAAQSLVMKNYAVSRGLV